jgi:hypothetical protein
MTDFILWSIACFIIGGGLLAVGMIRFSSMASRREEEFRRETEEGGRRFDDWLARKK